MMANGMQDRTTEMRSTTRGQLEGYRLEEL